MLRDFLIPINTTRLRQQAGAGVMLLNVQTPWLQLNYFACPAKSLSRHVLADPATLI